MIDDEAVIFDMVLNTSSKKFLNWFLDNWAISPHERINYDNCEYTIELKYLKPSRKFDRVTHEIEFYGKPFPSTPIGKKNKDGSTQKVLGLGFMSVIDIELDKIHIQGQGEDHVEFDYLVHQIGEHIAYYYSPKRIKIKGKGPELPTKPIPRVGTEEWFEYFHLCKAALIRYTLKDLASDSGYSHGYIRTLHAGCGICSDRKASKSNVKK